MDRIVLMVSYTYRCGLPKKKELFFFFEILNAATFRQQLVNFVPLVTSVEDAQEEKKAIERHKKQRKPGLAKLAGVNIAFSHKGFVKVRRFSRIRPSSILTQSSFLIDED